MKKKSRKRRIKASARSSLSKRPVPLPEPLRPSLPRCSFPQCNYFGTESHHITYEPEVVKPLCTKHHKEITIINTQQAGKYKRELSNRHRWRNWYQWLQGNLKARRTEKAMAYINEMWNPRTEEVYKRCLADIKGILALFDKRGRCLDIGLAREHMSLLKARWKNVVKELTGTEAELVVSEALSRISVRSNSIPDMKWTNDLYSARIDLEFYLKQAPIGRR